MNISTETKLLGGVLLATTVIIIGGAWLAGTRGVDGDNAPIAEVERLVRTDDPVKGPADARVTFVEFGDFQCPSCGAVHPILQQLKRKYEAASVRFVYRHFPLPQHEHAQLAAQAAVAAQAQGKFWEYHDKLFENQKQLTRADLERYAQDIGLDMEKFKTALEDGATKDAVAADKADGEAIAITGTPTFFINAIRYQGQYSVAELQAAIDKAMQQETP